MTIRENALYLDLLTQPIKCPIDQLPFWVMHLTTVKYRPTCFFFFSLTIVTLSIRESLSTICPSCSSPECSCQSSDRQQQWGSYYTSLGFPPLAIQYTIEFKVLLFVFKPLHGLPLYNADFLQAFEIFIYIYIYPFGKPFYNCFLPFYRQVFPPHATGGWMDGCIHSNQAGQANNAPQNQCLKWLFQKTTYKWFTCCSFFT